MRALLASVLLCASACGGLDNGPLRLGNIRGVVQNMTPTSIVSTEATETFPTVISTKPQADGRFELVGVPQGEVKLLILSSSTTAERITLNLQGGSVADVGAVGAAPSAQLRLVVEPPAFLSFDKATIHVGALELTRPLELIQGHEGLARIGLPSGCYPTVVAIPGLGSLSKNVCVEAPLTKTVEFEFPFPDGSAGREGCSVSGCLSGHTCLSNGLCSF